MPAARQKRIARVKVTLTERTIEALTPEARPWIAWDDQVTGFGVRVQPTGTKSFIVNYRAGDGGRTAPNRRVVIGDAHRVAPDQARRQARELLDRVAMGEDPAEARTANHGLPTLAEAFREYLAANPDRKETTARFYRGLMRNCFADWQERPLGTIARRDVEARFLHVSKRRGRTVANQAISMLRSVYRRPCVDFESLRNPVELWLAGGGRYHPSVRRRISAPSEVLPRWRRGIEAEVIVPATRDIFWCGLYTGLRVGEVFGLRWDRVNLARRLLRIDETKTGKPLVLPVTRQLAEVLERRRADCLGGAAAESNGAWPNGLGLPLVDQRLRPRGGAAAPVPPDLPGGGDQVLVPRAQERLHHGGRAGTHAAALAHQAAREPHAPHRRDGGLRRGLDHPAASRTGATDRGPDRGTDVRGGGGGTGVGRGGDPRGVVG